MALTLFRVKWPNWADYISRCSEWNGNIEQIAYKRSEWSDNKDYNARCQELSDNEK